ncbi:unnamed protein product [Periconia digitata]|uniref:Uncharacterized protein n=1 Tax=Periconia digitata TaxID=1303443 RepID=A0A9W4U4H5_9PLEO|nr:unnamed protein product [Periconia digitata]
MPWVEYNGGSGTPEALLAILAKLPGGSQYETPSAEPEDKPEDAGDTEKPEESKKPQEPEEPEEPATEPTEEQHTNSPQYSVVLESFEPSFVSGSSVSPKPKPVKSILNPPTAKPSSKKTTPPKQLRVRFKTLQDNPIQAHPVSQKNSNPDYASHIHRNKPIPIPNQYHWDTAYVPNAQRKIRNLLPPDFVHAKPRPHHRDDTIYHYFRTRDAPFNAGESLNTINPWESFQATKLELAEQHIGKATMFFEPAIDDELEELVMQPRAPRVNIRAMRRQKQIEIEEANGGPVVPDQIPVEQDVRLRNIRAWERMCPRDKYLVEENGCMKMRAGMIVPPFVHAAAEEQRQSMVKK